MAFRNGLMSARIVQVPGQAVSGAAGTRVTVAGRSGDRDGEVSLKD